MNLTKKTSFTPTTTKKIELFKGKFIKDESRFTKVVTNGYEKNFKLNYIFMTESLLKSIALKLNTYIK